MLAGSPLLLMRCALSRWDSNTSTMHGLCKDVQHVYNYCVEHAWLGLQLLLSRCIWPIESVHMCVCLSMLSEWKTSLQVTTDMVDAYFKRLRPDEELHLEESAQYLQSRL